ncbi:hypothetical protein BCR36DRAFT_584698 [Piromyces finnis]|uniref:Uncharacterized protein n=1 Tax=Piromyces finnis TaxID=1754191 RepID=A0A1Y1V613_9FUNG|nr:hypothetical protein BCR36DRAFT_584698 [Piromyces finnis]|eukprot:ORX47606.1 hypothetical protein BCR36DRAFT_584698 [Piromyces finnis]
MQAEIKTRLTQSMGESKKPIITYKDDTNIWQHISKELTSRFPLKDIECRGIGNQKMNRVINSLDIEWKPFTEEWQNKNVYTQLQQAPFLNLYFLNCSDLEQYKNTLKDKIKYWLNIIESKKNQEWMIICISGESNTKSILGIRTSIYDKIKSDFNLSKDRLMLVKLYSEVKEGDMWTAVVNKIKEKLLSCFFQQVLTLQEDIKRLDSQRLLPGWNYCSFFILKEQLALLYDTVNLYQDALVQYDELEASFYQTLVEQGAAWFKSFGGTEEGDDSLDFLNLKRKPFREMIIQNTTTIFDFRMYLFARQCQLLFRLDKPTELCQRAKLFISSFSMTLTDYKGVLFPYFRESWIYTTCMNIVSRCEELASISWHNNQTLKEFEGASGELLHLARSQLDILGRACNYLPDNLDKPTYDPENTEKTYNTEIFDKITNQHLKNLLSSVESFDEIYNLITSRAIHCFEGCLRQRSIWLLKSDIAKLHFYRGRLQEASEGLLPLCKLYAQESWHSIETNLLQMLAICQKQLNQSIPYLETCITLLANRSYIDEETFDKYTEEMIETVNKIDEEYEKEISSIFKYELKSLVHQLKNDSGILFEVCIINPFKKAIKIKNLNLELVSKENNKLIFDCEEADLEPGRNTIQLKCEHPISGKYSAVAIQFSINRFILKSAIKERSTKIYTVKETSSTLQIKASCVQPVEYEKPSNKLLLSIYSKSNSISNGTLNITSITGITLKYPEEIIYKIKKEESDEDERTVTIAYDSNNDYISLPECDENEVIKFEVPYVSEKLNISIHRMTFAFDYIMKNGVHRFHSLFEKVKISTPFIYNNNVTYSHDCTILQINFFSKDQVPIRIRKIELIAPGYEVEEFLIEKQQIIFQNQDVSLVYCLRNKDNDNTKIEEFEKDELGLYIDYYYLNEEIEAYITENVTAKLKEKNLSEYSGFLNKFLNSSYELVDSVKYGMYGKISLNNLAENYHNVEAIIESEESTAMKEKIDEVVDEVCKGEITTADNENSRIPLKTMIYKVKVPKSDILLEADLEMNQGNPIIGMICKGKLKIKQVKWNSDVDELKFYYDIAIRFDNWMVSGHKKRVFNLKSNEEKEFTFDFIPLKTGMLLIPTVEVNCITTDSPTIRVIHTSDAKQISVIPKTQSSTIYVNNSVFDAPDKNRRSYA